MEEQTCSRCHIPKTLDEFHKDKSRANGIKPACKLCLRPISKNWSRSHRADPVLRQQVNTAMRERRKDPLKRQAERNSQLKYRQTTWGRSVRMWLAARKRARAANHLFTVTKEFVHQELQKATEIFEQLGVPFDYSPNNIGRTPSLDQIRPGGGYITGNVRVVHWCWNAFKGDYFTEEEAIEFAAGMIDAYRRITKT